MIPSAAEVNVLKTAPTSKDVLSVIRHRWSPRSFSDREVSAQDLKTIFEGARWAASSSNEQPWRFLVGRRGSDTYQKIFNLLGEYNQAWAGSAPVLILGVTKTTFSRGGAPNYHALYDLGAAAATLCYQATGLGIFTHQMGGYDHDAARRAFDIPDDFVPGAVIALGYQGEPSLIKLEGQLKSETTPRQRRPLEETVFSGWGEAANLD